MVQLQEARDCPALLHGEHYPDTRHGTQGAQYSAINLSVSATPDKKRLSALAFDFISHASYSYGVKQTFVVFILVLT